ncbi:MAG TPA: type IX secretion system membrane protein PorP/SprF [Bacteroidetes bacterium]|nr:type IX secretion system membrane protein PorP/SprF [Bacteroidota bacterium]
MKGNLYRHLKGWQFKSLLAVGLWLASWAVVDGQQDPHHTQYLFNGLAINPAYAGSRGTVSGTFLYRQQWVGFAGAPRTQSLSMHMPGSKNRYGFGLTLINDQIGYLGQQWLQGSYAFIVPFGPGRLALGLQGGLLNFRINWAEVSATDQVDPIFRQTAASLLLPNFGTGLYYHTSRFYAGISAPHLLASRLNSQPGSASIAQLYRHYYFTSGIVIGPNNQIKWKPSILFKYIPGLPLQADFNLMVLFKERYWFGISYRTGDAISFMFDLQIGKLFRLGYAYDYTLSQLSRFQSGSHELYLGFELKTRHLKLKSPRYF